jgi:hypothetical protein
MDISNMLTSFFAPAQNQIVIREVENGYILVFGKSEKPHEQDQEEIEQDIRDQIDITRFRSKIENEFTDASEEDIREIAARMKRRQSKMAGGVSPYGVSVAMAERNTVKTYIFKTFGEVLDFLKENY